MEQFLNLSFMNQFAVARLDERVGHQSSAMLETHMALVPAYQTNRDSIDATLRQDLDNYYAEYNYYYCQSQDIEEAIGSVDAAPPETHTHY